MLLLIIWSILSGLPNQNTIDITQETPQFNRCTQNSSQLETEREDENDDLAPIVLNENDFLMDCCEETTIATIAASIEAKILSFGRFECNCRFVLERNEKVSNLTVSDESYAPCMSTLNICKIANIHFNSSRNQICFNYDFLLKTIDSSIDFDNVFSSYFDCESSHKKGFVKYIAEEFIRLQATYIAKNLTLIEQKYLCGKLLKKKIHFLGQ